MEKEPEETTTMSVLRKSLITVLSTFAIFALANMAAAQYGVNEATIRDTVRRIQSRTETLRSDVQLAANRGNLSASELAQLNRSVSDFRVATDQLDRRLSTRRASSADARLVLDRASLVDNYFFNNRVGAGANREWQSIRGDLEQLARLYNLDWQQSSGGIPTSGSNLSDTQLRQMVQRIDTRTSTFSRYLRQDLNRGNRWGSHSVQDIRQQLVQLESAVVRVRNRVNTRQLTSNDAQNLLERAAYLDRVVSDERFSSQTENNWTLLRSDFDRLANAFNIAWNWSTVPNGGYGAGNELTGTYRLNSSRSEDARLLAEQATRNLPNGQRQTVYNSLLRRLDPPTMLAIDRSGTSVTIASSRASQINFVADGREQVETTPNGRTVRVRAAITGDQLSITRTGDRADDFRVTFDSENNGRQLIVIRTIYSDRLGQPVVVRSHYDKTSDIAELNIYETNPDNGNIGGVTGTYVVPGGTEIVAVLNTDLSTETTRDNDRFSMTVRAPNQYEASAIEGYVTNVDRSGRVTGRAGMTLNFDTIRLRNGSTYRYAGILESVREPNGETVRVDNEGAIRDEDSQTNTTITRTAIGTAVGAIIGAIAGGGKGAAIGAAIGAGAGAGSVYVQGRNDLQLPAGTEITIRTTGPR